MLDELAELVSGVMSPMQITWGAFDNIELQATCASMPQKGKPDMVILSIKANVQCRYKKDKAELEESKEMTKRILAELGPQIGALTKEFLSDISKPRP